MSTEKVTASAAAAASMSAHYTLHEQARAVGMFSAVLHDRAGGKVIAEHKFPNTVLTVGKNYLLDNGFSGSAYTAALYIGLISSVSYSAIAATDIATAHAGWLEAGATNAPTYGATRPSAVWAAATGGSKSLSAGLVFTFTGAGTLKGCFLATTAAVDSTTGTYYSAGLFTGGDQPVVSGNTLTVNYTASL